MIPASMLRLGSGLLLPLLAAASGYALGCGQSRHYWQTKLQAAVAEMQAADSRAQQQRQAAALEQQRQWRQRTDQLESRLLLQQQALQAQQRRQAQRIDDVTRNDGSRFTGLGPDSLRLYRQLLGYSDPLPGAQSLPAGAAAQTAGPDATRWVWVVGCRVSQNTKLSALPQLARAALTERLAAEDTNCYRLFHGSVE
ncbi:hypothetical protein, partial [Chromobacterium phragmitis]